MDEFKNELDSGDEIVVVRLPKSSVKILQEVVRREQAYNWFHNKIKNWWIISVAAGVIIMLTLLEKVHEFSQYWSVK